MPPSHSVSSPAFTFPAGLTSPHVGSEMPARPNMFIRYEAKGNFVKTTKPAGLQRRGRDGRNLIRKIQPLPALQKRSITGRSERAQRSPQRRDCFPCRENFSMFISDIGLPDESGRGGGRLTQTAKHTGAAQTKRLASFWQQQQEAHSRLSHPVGLLLWMLEY